MTLKKLKMKMTSKENKDDLEKKDFYLWFGSLKLSD